jgi:hypothetical protein
VSAVLAVAEVQRVKKAMRARAKPSTRIPKGSRGKAEPTPGGTEGRKDLSRSTRVYLPHSDRTQSDTASGSGSASSRSSEQYVAQSTGASPPAETAAEASAAAIGDEATEAVATLCAGQESAIKAEQLPVTANAAELSA